MTPEELRALLRQPEGETLEFKSGLPDAYELQRVVAAFANTHGGTVVLGFDERAQRAVGLAHPGVAAGHVQEWLEGVTPPLDVDIESVEIEPATHLVVVRVPQGRDFPYLGNGQAVERKGDRVVPISRERIVGRFAAQDDNRPPATDPVADAIATQSAEIAGLRRDVTTLSTRLHWRRQLPIRAGAALGGAVVTYLLTNGSTF